MLDIEELIEELRRVTMEPAPAPDVREILARALARPREELELALGPATGAEMRPLYRSPQLTVLKMVWAPDMQIPPHDHRMWAVIGIVGGAEDNAFFRRTPRGLERAGDERLEDRDAIVLGDRIIHAVHNPRSSSTLALHVYGGDFFATPRSEWDPVTFEERASSGERMRELFRKANERLETVQTQAR